MGVTPNVGPSSWPKQGNMLGEHVSVSFARETSTLFAGLVVRDDIEDPFRTIIQLDDGRFVLGSECQWSVRK